MKKAVTVTEISDNHHKVTITLPDVVGLMSLIAGLFTSYGMDIREANIRTVDAEASDTFRVLSRSVPDWNEFERDLMFYAGKLYAGGRDEVVTEISDRIVAYLRAHHEDYQIPFAPIALSLDQDTSEQETMVNIESRDTPAFLYELTQALALLGFNITRMEVETVGSQVRDRLWVTTENGEKVTSEKELKILQWAILLIKHFTHLLPKVPDPKRAREAILLFGKDIFERDDFNEILLTLRDSEAIGDLSRVLGTSRFLWEQFLRYQNETIFEILGDRRFLITRRSKAEMMQELQGLLDGAADFDAKVESLNEFKDREMFRVDLRHMLQKTSFLEEFAEELTDLTEVVAEAGCNLAWAEVAAKFTSPRVSDDEASTLSLCALGKFGGAELGLASDVELMFVYTDDPDSTSARSQANSQFYTELVRKFLSVIKAKHEGVFEIDLRLRPYGKDGPLAVSLGLFESFYSEKGQATSFERQALVKLRPFAGPESLKEEIIQLRDAFVYSGAPFDVQEAYQLRQRQRKELVAPGSLNAKYSLGGLLDVEYLVQTLQILYGSGDADPALKQPKTIKALQALQKVGVLNGETHSALFEAYAFLRELINALRVARGNAKDLNIPKWETPESAILARRMVYSGVDFSGDDAAVNHEMAEACRRHMDVAGRCYEFLMNILQETRQVPKKPVSFPGFEEETVIAFHEISETPPEEMFQHLERLDFSDAAEAVKRLQRLLKHPGAEEILNETIRRADSFWSQLPDPDLALRQMEQFSEHFRDRRIFWDAVKEDDKFLQRLLLLFGSSRYLSEVLTGHPEYWEWLQHPQEIALTRMRERLAAEETKMLTLEELRQFRHRETLRIALCEMLRQEPLPEIWRAFSDLADFVLKRIAEIAFGSEEGYFVLGLGKFGGRELNFSSDVDLIFVTSREDQDPVLVSGIQKFCNFMSQSSPEGFLYRIDLRLRPFGAAGALLLAVDSFTSYYEQQADAWEYQMLIKARAVAGNIGLGESVLERLYARVYRPDWHPSGVERLREIKRQYEAETAKREETETNIKMGSGGIRDVEFAIQMIQLLNGHKVHGLQTANTSDALKVIEEKKLLSSWEIRTLREGYVFLRSIENKIHLFDNQQDFILPADLKRLRWLAKSLGFQDGVSGTAEEQFQLKLVRLRQDCRTIFEQIFYGIRQL